MSSAYTPSGVPPNRRAASPSSPSSTAPSSSAPSESSKRPAIAQAMLTKPHTRLPAESASARKRSTGCAGRAPASALTRVLALRETVLLQPPQEHVEAVLTEERLAAERAGRYAPMSG